MSTSFHAITKRRTIAALATTTTLLLAGCSVSNGGPAPSSGGPLSGTIRVLSNWSGSEGKAFQAMVDGFTAKNPGVTVKLDTVPFDQTQAVITQQFAAGNPPAAAVALPGIVRQLSSQGLLMNLDSLWNSWETAGEYNKSLRAIAAGSDGHTDAVYVKGNVNGLIWYKTATLAAAGLTVPPPSWGSFIAMLDQVKAKGHAPFSVGAKDVWVPTQWVDPILLNVAGATKYAQLQRGKIGWDDPAVVKAFTVLAGLIKNYWPKNALDTGFSDETCGWVTGNHYFANNGAFVNGIVASCNSNLKPGTDYTFFTMPSYSGGTTPPQAVSGDLFVGAKNSKNPAVTKAFLKYLGSVDAQTIWAKRGGYIAPNMKVPSSVYPTINDQRAAALWPKDASGVAGYDLDDWIGGQIQSKYRDALVGLIRTQDVSAFIATMKARKEG